MTVHTDRAYMAGVLDSDGYIGVQRHGGHNWQPSYSSRIKVKQVVPEAVALFKATFGGYVCLQQPSAKRGRPLWAWEVHSAAVRPVLTAVLPYLRIKRAQAENALSLCEVNARHGIRRFPVPTIIAGEPMVSAREASDATGLTYDSVCQAVRLGSVPSTREGRHILIPASFLPIWRDRGTSPRRDPAITAEMHSHYERAKELNRVGT